MAHTHHTADDPPVKAISCFKQANLNRLHNLGYRNYCEYLQSDHWAEVKRRYRDSGRPLRCLACHNPKFELHHRSYTRLGCELIDDLIPLCRDCHEKVHAYIKDHPEMPIQATHKILRVVFGWTKSETERRFRPHGKSGGFRWVDRSDRPEV